MNISVHLFYNHNTISLQFQNLKIDIKTRNLYLTFRINQKICLYFFTPSNPVMAHLSEATLQPCCIASLKGISLERQWIVVAMNVSPETKHLNIFIYNSVIAISF